jgi:hypothetical protein
MPSFFIIKNFLLQLFVYYKQYVVIKDIFLLQKLVATNNFSSNVSLFEMFCHYLGMGIG